LGTSETGCTGASNTCKVQAAANRPLLDKPSLVFFPALEHDRGQVGCL